MRRFLLPFACLVPMAFTAGAAVHVWRGTVSDRFSEAANWDGGSPAGDPEAELSFPAGSRVTAVNDIPGLRVRSIAISGAVTITGNAMTLQNPAAIDQSSAATNEIACDLVLSGPLVISRSGSVYDADQLRFTGSISGTGDVTKSGGGRIGFAGTSANTYAGTTYVRAGELRLAKPPGVNGVPGDVVVKTGGTGFERTYLIIPNGEQIPDSAKVAVHHNSELQLGAVETIGPLLLDDAASLLMAVTLGGTYPLTGGLVMTGDIELAGSFQQPNVTGALAISGSRVLNTGENHQGLYLLHGLYGTSPSAGLTVRGTFIGLSGVSGTAWYTGPTIVEGASVSLVAASSPVIVRGGTFAGTGASIDVESGRLGRAQSQSYIRVSPTAMVTLRVAVDVPSLVANGPVDLGGATATLDQGTSVPSLGRIVTIVENKSTSPTTGTFLGWPEGTVIDGRFRISYTGGTGNDVTVTEVGRYSTRTHLSIEPQRVGHGESAQLIAEVTDFRSSTIPGTVTFLRGTETIATAALDANRKATATATLPHGTHKITARYDGTAELAPSQDERALDVLPPVPVITSIEPSTVTGGTEVELTVRGSSFLDGARVYSSSSVTVFPTTFVSASELRAKLTPSDSEAAFDLAIAVQQANPCCVNSSSVPLHVTPRVRERSPLVFETRQVSAPVTPGATSVWLVKTRRPSFPAGLLFAAAIVDEDRDGWARVQLSQDLQPFGIWTATDLTTGRLMAGDARGNVPRETPFPAKMFLRDAAGNFSQAIMSVAFGASWDFLWVRPGAGAWYLRSINNGFPSDLDGTYDRQLVFSTAGATPLQGSPATPAGVQKGDVWVAIDSEGGSWFGATLGAQLDETSGPGVLELVSGPRVAESAGVANVKVVRSEGTDGPVSVRYATRDDTAVAGMHYQAVSGTLDFGPGEIVKTIAVPVADDLVFSGNRRFFVEVSEPVGTTLRGNASTIVIIYENEQEPEVSFGEATVVEGDSGSRTVALPVTLDRAATVPVTVTWAWRGGEINKKLVFTPGETRKTVSVPITANTLPQPDRVVDVWAMDVENGDDGKQGRILVIDDDFATLTVSDATVNENAGTVTVRVSISEGGKPVTAKYATRAGSAGAGADFTMTSGTLQITRGASFTVPILNDAIGESAEWFSVVLSDVIGARVVRGTAVVSIEDDEPPSAPVTVSARDVEAAEGDAGTGTLLARIQLSKPAPAPVTLSYATGDGLATPGVDYVPKSGALTFAAGEKEKTIAITISGDTEVEPDEPFFLTLSGVQGASVENGRGALTIVDDDGSSKRRTSRH